MTPGAGETDAPRLSIIVPVYNVSAYLREGLDSLRGQQFDHPFEVILVDDCSTDGSLDICREFSTRYPKLFRLAESETNAGVSVARNTGLAMAGGRYLMFFDPDDLLPPGTLDAMHRAAERFSADIVKGNLVLFDEDSEKPAPDRVRRTRLIEGEAVLTTLYEHALVRGHVGGKLFRRDRFGALRFQVGVRMAQDLLYFSGLFARADSLLLLARDVYRYRKHPHGSTGRKYQKGSYIDWLGAVEKSGEFARTRAQRAAHRGLLLRTMAQIARECRKIEPQGAAPVLDVIERKCIQWRIRFCTLLLGDRLGPRDLFRYVKLRQAVRRIRRNLAHS